ncbi:hypothetical protein BKA81DRAFT_50443 [Phyllosticta paracitricarpa]
MLNNRQETNKQTDKQTNRQTDKQTNRQTHASAAPFFSPQIKWPYQVNERKKKKGVVLSHQSASLTHTTQHLLSSSRSL